MNQPAPAHRENMQFRAHGSINLQDTKPQPRCTPAMLKLPIAGKRTSPSLVGGISAQNLSSSHDWCQKFARLRDDWFRRGNGRKLFGPCAGERWQSMGVALVIQTIWLGPSARSERGSALSRRRGSR
jgi:hypothetical protein